MSDSTISFLQLRLDVREPALVAGFGISGVRRLRRIGCRTTTRRRHIAVSLVAAAIEKMRGYISDFRWDQ